MPENQVITVSVPEDQLTELLTQLDEYKADIIALVSVFKKFEVLFSGKGSVMSLIPVITKMISDKKQMEELAYLLPIIEKYTNQPANHETN